MEQAEKSCLNCEKPIKGRTDKKFCNDYCRNNYNNRQKNDDVNLVRNINNLLKKNRKILADLVPEEEDMKKIPRQKLADAGFNFKYQTHLYKNQKEQTYHFIYDYGYLSLENDWVLIVKRR